MILEGRQVGGMNCPVFWTVMVFFSHIVITHNSCVLIFYWFCRERHRSGSTPNSKECVPLKQKTKIMPAVTHTAEVILNLSFSPLAILPFCHTVQELQSPTLLQKAQQNGLEPKKPLENLISPLANDATPTSWGVKTAKLHSTRHSKRLSPSPVKYAVGQCAAR